MSEPNATVVRDGTMFDADADCDGEPTGSVGDLQRWHQLMFDTVQAGITLHAADTELLLANPRAADLLGVHETEMIGARAEDPRWLFLGEDGSSLRVHDFPVNRALAARAPVRDYVIGIRQRIGGDVVWVQCDAYPVFEDDGVLAQVVVSFTDVTSLKQAQLALRKSEERLRLVLRGANDAAWDWDLITDELYYSPRWWQMIGIDPDQQPVDAALWRRLMHPDDAQRVDQVLRQALEGEGSAYEVEFRLLHRDGHYVPVLSHAFILRDALGHAVRVSGTNTDLTERKRAEEQINQLAYYDPLTALPNRRLLLERLHHAQTAMARTHEQGAVLFIDLDNFKVLNDTWGHHVGDELLVQVAARLRDAVRGDDTVARLGGDEFVVVLEGLGTTPGGAAATATKMCEKVAQALGGLYRIASSDYRGTASIGVALFDGALQPLDVVLRQADLAMYQAKDAGRDTFRFFDVTMQAAAEEQLNLQHDLRQALAGGELLLHLQRQVAADGSVVGAEALVRWQHPDRGLILPMKFIPVAEQTGMIVPVGEWVLRTACSLLARWAGEADLSRLTVSINVSVRQFRDAGFVDSVRKALSDHQVNPELLRLEITESLLADDVAAVVATMTVLRQLGVAFSLDDFGTGYSSLNYLQRMPLDEVKIDRGFVRDVLVNTQDATIVRIVLLLGETLGLTVVAEGVESEEQARFLVDHGCRRMQGYFFGRPAPVEEFEKSLRTIS